MLAWVAVAACAVLAVGLVAAPSDMASRTLVAGLALGCLVAWIARQDVRTFTIPDAAVLALAVLALAWRWTALAQWGDLDVAAILSLAIDAALPGGVLLAFREIYFRRKGFDGIGLGDVKLAAAGGLLVGVVGFSWALLAASLLGLGFVAMTRLSPKSRGMPFAGSEKIAFGALLAPAILAVWVAQQMAVSG